jgi:predicted NAD/FAD-binding protein
MKIAIIGSGISGLGAAYRLSARHEVHVFEREGRVGGHTHTVNLEDGTAVDTGFIVHNRVNYPLFVRLMEELGVQTGPSDMSFAFDGPELPWCSRGLNGVLTKRSHALSPRFWRFWKEVARFNAWGERLAREGVDEASTLREALDAEGFSADFRNAYLLPMAGAVWSTPPSAMGDFPALTLLRFFWNHGMLGFASQHPWRTIPGGTSRYLEPLCQPFRERIHLGVQLASVRRSSTGAHLQLKGDGELSFDQVVFACHGDQVLPLLADATPLEREILGAFKSNASPTWLHTDTSILPAQRRAWASWNFRRTADERLLLTYHMNRLQDLGRSPDLLVTLHGHGQVDESKVLRRFDYEHPRYDLPALRAQKRWVEISGSNRTHYAGAYWGNGFHEAGLSSGFRVVESLAARGEL